MSENIDGISLENSKKMHIKRDVNYFTYYDKLGKNNICCSLQTID
jgi:hypothetical protein